MDVRDTEEYRKKHLELVRKQQLYEVSARNILIHLHSAETLRKKVYEDKEIGNAGFTYGMVAVSMLFGLFSSTLWFSKHFPRAYDLIGRRNLPKLVIIAAAARIGLIFEQDYIENGDRKIEFEKYMVSYNYAESLIDKKNRSMDLSYRLGFLFGDHAKNLSRLYKAYFGVN